MKKIITYSLLVTLILTNFIFNPSQSLADESVDDISSVSFKENIVLNLPEINETTLANSTNYEVRKNIDYYLNEYKNIQSMSIDELNAYISSIKEEQERADLYKTQSVPSYTKLQGAWLAAAELAKKAGYPVAGTMVQCSVLGIDYTENNGLVVNGLAAKKIKQSDVFRTLLYSVKKTKQPVNKSYIFYKYDDPDLFYAFHEAKFNIAKDRYTNNYRTHLYDYFDFALEKVRYDDLFTTLVNDWAWLNQYIYILRNININIDFLTT